VAHARISAFILLVSLAAAVGIGLRTVDAQSLATPAYAAVGDSIEFGVGDTDASDGIGYVDPFGDSLSTVLQQTVSVHNFSVPGADTREILLTQVPPALAALRGHDPVIVTWGGGGNDLASVATTPQANACLRQQGCLGRFNGLLNEAEAAIEQTIALVRLSIGPSGRILMRTQYNALARSGCAPPALMNLTTAVLEGASGTVLDQGLNDRIKSVAARHGARVVDLFVPVAMNPNALIAADCVHPSSAGYAAIESLFEAAYLLGPQS
jgi:lysophospholipase L1-like esterase